MTKYAIKIRIPAVGGESYLRDEDGNIAYFDEFDVGDDNLFEDILCSMWDKGCFYVVNFLRERLEVKEI